MDKHITEDIAMGFNIPLSSDELDEICSILVREIMEHAANKVGIRIMSVCDKPFILCHPYVPLHTSKTFSYGWPEK